jgi:hypothetical protein
MGKPLRRRCLRCKRTLDITAFGGYPSERKTCDECIANEGTTKVERQRKRR